MSAPDRKDLFAPESNPPKSRNGWFETLADMAPMAIAVYQHGRWIYVNQASADLSGYTREELLELDPFELSHRDFRGLLSERARRRLAGQEVPSQYSIRYVTKAGEDRLLRVTARQIEVAGEPAILCTGLDDTDHQQALDALQESEQRLRLAQRAGRSCAWEWDLETDVLTFCDEVEDLFGIERSAVGSTAEEFLEQVHPEDRDRLKEALRKLLRDREDLSLEIRVRVGERDLWLSERAVAVRRDDDRAVRVVGVASDVTGHHQALEALRTSEERYRQMFEKNRAMKLLIDPADGTILQANPAAEAFYGFESLQGSNIGTINTLPADEVRQRIAEVMREERTTFLFPHRLASGERKDMEVLTCPIRLGDQTIIYSILHDVTDRLRAERALEREKELAQVTLASIGDGVIRTDVEGRVNYLNPVAEELTGLSLEEALDLPVDRVLDRLDETSRQALPSLVLRCLQEDRVIRPAAPAILRRRDGQEFCIRESAAPIHGAGGEIAGSVLIFRDITAVRGMEQEVSFLARHDPLTGLFNRRQFEERIRNLMADLGDGKSHALGCLDLDEFKVINDTCGHVAGDELLKQVARLLEGQCRPEDTLGRLGSDEFGLLLEDTTVGDAVAQAEAIRNALGSYRFVWEDKIFEIGASIGLVPLDRKTGDLVQALQAADAACYVAKEEGRNRIHVYRQDDTALAERHGEMRWIQKIHQAFEKRRFVLYHQPIEPLSGRGTGASGEGGPAEGRNGDGQPPRRLSEIFIRMIDDDGRLVTPGSFIPAAERYHLITSVDRWVVENAFDLLSRSTSDCNTLPYTFTINLSGQSLADANFLSFMIHALEDSGVPPWNLCFEITETAAVANLTRAKNFITVIRSMGCSFVLDDFGSGLSSFAYLKNLPVDYVKIDGEFVRGLRWEPVQRAIIEAISQISHVMGFRTIGESVEDQETLDTLREIGVDYAQGYHLARPSPLEQALVTASRQSSSA